MLNGPEPDPGTPDLHVRRLPVLGIATTFVSHDPAVMAAVEAAYGHWAGHAEAGRRGGAKGTRVGAEAGPLVRIRVGGEAGASAAGSGVAHEVSASTRLVLRAPGIAGEADAAGGRAEAMVAPDVVHDTDRFVRDVLEPLTLFLLGRLDREPVHAAAIVRGGAAILLAGPSGTGKSTLTYAASRHGFSVLADEPVYVQLEPRLRVWGRRARLHLPPDVRTRFPELADRDPVRLPTGKTKLVIDMPDGPRSAERACLCVLRRRAGAVARLHRLDPAAAVEEVTARLDPGFDLFADTIPERIARVAGGGAWALELSDDPADALPLLEEVAAEMEAGR